MQTRRFTRIPGMTLAVMLTLLVGQGLVFGHDDGDRTAPSKLEGAWDVTLKFPEKTCDRTECRCPGDVPNIPIPTLNTFLKHGGMLWSATTFLVGPGQGSWERIGHNHFMARFKFYIFDLETGFSTSSEEVTQDIHLTGRDTYTGAMPYDLFNAEGSMIAQECHVNIDTAKRFE
jgi:hypothetical protein